MTLQVELESTSDKQKTASSELAKKESEFNTMGEALAKQAQEKAMLKMENMQMKQEMMMA